MSDIGKFQGGAHWSGSSNGSDMQRRDLGKRQEKAVNLGHSSVSGGDHGDTAVTAETLSAFERSIRIAGKSLGEKDGGNQEDPLADARLLAQAESAAATSSLPSFADLAASPSTSLPSAGSHLVATVTQHIEEAIRADMRPAKDAPLTLHLNFAGETAGLTGLTMAVTPTTLDVVLERVAGDLTPELLAATAALADRLRVRFGKRVVRILDKVANPTSGAEQSLASLFATSGG